MELRGVKLVLSNFRKRPVFIRKVVGSLLKTIFKIRIDLNAPDVILDRELFLEDYLKRQKLVKFWKIDRVTRFPGIHKQEGFIMNVAVA